MRTTVRYLTKLIIVFACYSVCITTAAAQKLVIEKLSPDVGLASNQTYQALQDRYGYMWFACTGGLSRYDGYSFTNFNSTDGLSHSTVLSLAEDATGQLWIGTEGGLNCLSTAGLKGYFSQPQVSVRSFPHIEPLNKKWISALTIDKDRKLWIGVQNYGLYILDISLSNDTAALRQSLKKVDVDNELSKSAINSIYDDGIGQIWVSSGNGLYCVNKINSHIRHYTTADGLLSNEVTCVRQHESLILWIGTSRGLCFMDMQSRQLLPPAKVRNGFTLSDPVTHLLEDHNNDMWIGTRNGVYRKERNSERVSRLSTSNGLSDNFIRFIFQDRENLMWFTTDAAGVNHLLTEKFSNYNHENGLPSNVARCFAEDSRGRVWIGTSKGLTIYDGGDFNPVQIDRRTPDQSVWVIYPGGNYRFWVGTQNGVYLLSEQGQMIKHLSPADGIVDRGIRDIILDSDQNLWIATQLGLSVYNQKTGKIANYTSANGLPALYVRSLSIDRFGTIWLGTRGGGLCRVINRNDDFINVETFSVQNGFPSQTIGRVFHDAHGRMWVSTHNGVVVMDSDNKRTEIRYKLTVENGLPHNLVSTVQQDRNGYLWVCGDKGTCQVQFNEKDSVPFSIIKYYNKKSGMAGEEFTTNNSIYLDRSGSLWFGLFGGVTVYHPEKDILNDVPPYIYITGVSLIGKEGNPEPAASTLFNWNWDNSSMLSHDQNNLNFNFTALTFQNSEQTFYQYFLEGFDADWSSLTQKREVRYTNLSPGEYTFHVRAKTPNGLWSHYTADMSFNIAPAFWDTWIFRILVTGIAGACLFALFKLRTRRIHHTNRELEMKIAERTHELTGKNQQLKELNQLKDEFLNIAAHDLRNPLNSILCTSRIIVEDSLKNDYDADKYLAHDMNAIIQASHHMLELINNLLDLAKIEAGKIHLNIDRRDINLLIREQIEAAEPIARQKNISIIYNADHQPVYSRMDKEKIWQAFNNLISNAIKFTDPGGHIKIELKPGNSEITVSITDTGRGIPKEKLNKVFDKFSELSRVGTGGERGTGLGMAITKSIIELHGGRIWVDSEPGKGTCFTFTLISSEETYAS